ncbi:MAG: DUF1861 family protein [Clostridium sp.]|uniref:DUF1861 family protein n=1 Tax=Clostridium sp. TaxID=1506 RepID=UPI003D6D45B1
MKKSHKLKTCNDLLIEFYGKNVNVLGEKLKFLGVQGRDVYNITKPFEDDGELIIAGRVEPRDSEVSEINFFREVDGTWEMAERKIKLNLQDPFATKICRELILGGVEIFPHPKLEGCLAYRTVFYRGADINSLQKFAVGPDLMKDIRLLELSGGRILVFTRPQGDTFGRGKIAFNIINSLEELNADVISNAELLESQFVDEEWGGANELHVLNNGLIGVLGHVASFDEIMDRHYYAMVFSFNLETKKASPIKLIATRKNFKPGEYKRKDIIDVIFSGGINRIEGAMAEIYVGVSDAESHKILIDDPFVEYESTNK